MTARKPKDDERELLPHFIYRKTSKIAQRVIGLGPTQINQGIKDGTIPPPLNLTGDGRAQGWLGSQLIELQRKRLAEAETAAAEPRQNDTAQRASHSQHKEPSDG
jgi:hypothetical protein